jgi:putative exporter of polyketide antibiotics
MGTDWLAIFTVAVFSIIGFMIAAFVVATLLTSMSRRNRRNFEIRHHRSKSRGRTIRL